MTLTIFSNFLNHHQKPICDEFHKVLGSKFKFISTIPMPESFVKNGYPNYTKIKYNHLSYENDAKMQRAKELGFNSDFVIIGSAPKSFVEKRIKNNKHTFWYSERVFRKSFYEKFNPRLLKRLMFKHTINRNKNVYLLCNSAFTANDFNWVFAYPNKKYKWGYFPDFRNIDIEEILKNKNKQKIKILFVARLIRLKHPELALKLAQKLSETKINFELNIIGTGPLESELKEMRVNYNLNEQVKFLKSLPNKKVLDYFINSDIFIFTSDRNEGWGAVANEAMSNGCALVASNEIGSIPYLVKNNITGLVFESQNIDSLFEQVKLLIENSKFREFIARNAYYSIERNWSPKRGAENFLKLCNSILELRKNPNITGPCSKADSTALNWYLR